MLRERAQQLLWCLGKLRKGHSIEQQLKANFLPKLKCMSQPLFSPWPVTTEELISFNLVGQATLVLAYTLFGLLNTLP